MAACSFRNVFAVLLAAALAFLLLAVLVSTCAASEGQPCGTVFLFCGALPQAPAFTDSDCDGLGDYWELSNYETLDQDGSPDADGDGLDNRSEFLRGTDPFVADSDGDGMPDFCRM
jgi:hypothetical protein